MSENDSNDETTAARPRETMFERATRWLRHATKQELTRDECGCGCPTCVKHLGDDLVDNEGLPTWYWAGPSPCREASS